jgi:hypothetical protein
MTERNIHCLPGEIYIKGYTRKDGVRVPGYCRLRIDIEDPIMESFGFKRVAANTRLNTKRKKYLKKYREEYYEENRKK